MSQITTLQLGRIITNKNEKCPKQTNKQTKLYFYCLGHFWTWRGLNRPLERSLRKPCFGHFNQVSGSKCDQEILNNFFCFLMSYKKKKKMTCSASNRRE